VLLGRPYHHDPGLNHGIAEELQKLGYAVFSQSTLPLDEDLLDRLFGDEVRAGAIAHPLDISDVWKISFSPIFSVIEEIVERSGTPFFAFKDLDENRPAGSIKLRLETIDYSLRRYQERLAQRRRAEARIGRWVGEYERRLRTRLEPDPSPDAPA
jgi:predicted nucleotide-binding protein (sugar kinase/HSP70/actin superfamily)